MSMMIIKIDVRETELIKCCQHFITICPSYKNISVVVETLPIADIILIEEGKEIVFIERKSIKDLAASIKDGRYTEQSYRLNGLPLNNHNIIYLLEGDVNKFNMFKDKNKIDKMTIYSAMVSLLYYKGFSVLRSFNVEETALIICNMAFKINKSTKEGKKAYYKAENIGSVTGSVTGTGTGIGTGTEKVEELTQTLLKNDDLIPIAVEDYCSVIKKVKKENITPGNIGEIMLCQIPGISSVTAIAIMKKFNTLQNMILKIKEDSTCLNEITYINKSGQIRRINKTSTANIIQYLII